MRQFEAQATIARTPEATWTYAADILRHPEWMTVSTAEVLRGRGEHLGDRGRERLSLALLKWEIEFEVIAAEPGRRIAWRAVNDPRFVHYEVGLDLEAAGPGETRARYWAAFQMRGAWRLLSPLLAMEGPAGVRRELGRLKEMVEQVPLAAVPA